MSDCPGPVQEDKEAPWMRLYDEPRTFFSNRPDDWDKEAHGEEEIQGCKIT